MTTDVPESYRPALVTLSQDMRELTEELLDGLRSERRVLTWLQEITVGTLGYLDQLVYEDMARQFRGDQGVLLGALLVESKREGDNCDLSEGAVVDLRQRFLAEFVHPAHRNAFRDLRSDATEYVDGAADEDVHNPDRQRFVAMRPALTELQQWQDRALSQLLDGFDGRDAVLDWGHDILLATHGELGEEWISRCCRERSTLRVLTGDTPADADARRLFAAYHVLPQFRAGVRVLSGRAGEMAEDGEINDTEPPDW